MSEPPVEFPVVIVGAGLVGASLALGLLQRLPDIRVHIIDPHPPLVGEPCAEDYCAEDYFDPRVVAINGASQALLAQLGIWPSLTRLCAYQRMQVWDGEGTGQIDFSAQECGDQQLGWIVENDHLLGQLHRQLAQHPRLSWQTDTVVGLQRSQQHWQLTTASGASLQTPLVLAADGARSPLRELAGIRVRQWSYGQTAIVCRVVSERPHAYTAYQRFSHQGPLAFLPLFPAHGGDCSIVWSLQNDMAQQMLALPDTEFKQALQLAFEGKLGRIEHCDSRVALPLHQCHAISYGREGLILLGDAAHAIHPLAGQGVNLGFADVACLLEQLQRASARGLPLSHASLLDRYQRERMPHNLTAMAAMETFKRLFGNANPYVGLVRNLGLGLAGKLPGLKQQFMRLASGR